MTNKSVTFFLLVVGIFATSVLLLAHHSDSVADQTKMVVITGTVTRFAFVNPHSTIYLAVKNEKGQVEEWSAWGGNPDQYRPAGWTRNTFKPGDKLTIYGFPHRDGTKSMIHLKIFRPNEEVPAGRNERQFVENYESVYGKQQFAYRPE